MEEKMHSYYEQLRKEMQVGQTRTERGYCEPEEIAEYQKNGFKVENFQLGLKMHGITRVK